jgi:hypothetical protein
MLTARVGGARLGSSPYLCDKCEFATDRRLPIQSGMNASLVIIDGESTQLAMKVETIPEEGLVEILAPKSCPSQ